MKTLDESDERIEKMLHEAYIDSLAFQEPIEIPESLKDAKAVLARIKAREKWD